jgi:hypothetical protein
MKRLSFSFVAVLLFGMMACTTAYKKSVGGDTEQVFSRIYMTDFNTAWQAGLEALKSSPLEISNREAGFIRTKWVDNTSDRRLFESFGAGRSFLKAQYRFRVSIGKGFYESKPSVKISVQREQLVQHDVLEGWRPVVSDSIEENTLLYRVGRIILIRTKIARMEEERKEKAIQSSELNAKPATLDGFEEAPSVGEDPDAFVPEEGQEPPPTEEPPPSDEEPPSE